MTRWVCPRCDREFAARQSHVCAPGISVDELLSRHPSWVGEVYEAVVEPIRNLGPLHEDAVDVGIFLKSDRKIAEFRPRVRAAHLGLFLPEAVDHPLAGRVLPVALDRVVTVLKLTSAVQVDTQLIELLEAAYDFNTDY